MMTPTQPHFATRLNSFALGGGVAHPANKTPTLELVEIAGGVAGLTALEVNYPEHFVDTTPAEMLSAIKDAHLVNTGIQVRWPAQKFSEGGFTHPSAQVRADAVQTAKEAVDVCREMGSDHVVLWPAHDGYEYPFQMDYRSAWQHLLECYGEVADHARGITVSIEFKPADPAVDDRQRLSLSRRDRPPQPRRDPGRRAHADGPRESGAVDRAVPGAEASKRRTA